MTGIQIALRMFFIALDFGAGFYVATRFDMAKQEQAAQAALAAQVEAETRTKNIADSYEQYRAGNETYIANLLSQVRKSHVKTPVSTGCVVPADRMQQIRDAVAGTN